MTTQAEKTDLHHATQHSSISKDQQSGPSTPTFTATPMLSSASPDTPGKLDTPYIEIKTPSQKQRMKGKIGVGVQVEEDNVKISEQDGLEDVRGLGIDKVDQVDQDTSVKDFALDFGARAIPTPKSPDTSRHVKQDTSATSAEQAPAIHLEEHYAEFPDTAELIKMKQRFLEVQRTGGNEEEVSRFELSTMITKLLTPALSQLPFLYGQIEAQRATIATLQAQAKLAAQIAGIDRERHAAERAGWHAETRALLHVRDNEAAVASRPKKVLDLDVGYHNELEAANKRLEMDNRLMAPRLADTQRQIDKLVTELRHLRSNVILSTTVLQGDAQIPPPFTVDRPQTRSPAKSNTPFATTMGDARAEHLLLAAKKVRSMRAQDPTTGLITMNELTRHGVVGPSGGVGYSEGYGGLVEIESEDELMSEDEEEEEFKPMFPPSTHRGSISKGKGRGSVQGTPLLPRAKRISKRNLPGPTTPRARKNDNGPPATTPGGSNFDDLLRAAEMANRPVTPPREGKHTPHIPMSVMSATRSTTRIRADSESDHGSPVKKARRIDRSDNDRPWPLHRRASDGDSHRLGPTAMHDERHHPNPSSGEHEASALDLLAQASQLEVAQNDQDVASPLVSASRFEGMMDEGDKAAASPQSSLSSGLAPPLELRSSDTVRPATQESPTLPSQMGTGPDENGRPVFIQPALPSVTTPVSRPRKLSNVSELATPTRSFPMYPPDSPFDDPPGTSSIDLLPGAFASPTGAAVPGLGKYVHLSSSMPARRVRSPYLKWTVEEDELLARAVAMHGEKWDLVSKGVPTRSYHQVRQRWLRKTGAFDKKPSLGSGVDGDTGLGMGLEGLAEDGGRDTSPTPQSGKAKKRKQSDQA